MTWPYRIGWFSRRVALVSSPLPLTGGAALMIQGKLVEGIALGVIAAAMYAAGRRTRGQSSE